MLMDDWFVGDYTIDEVDKESHPLFVNLVSHLDRRSVVPMLVVEVHNLGRDDVNRFLNDALRMTR